MEPTRSERRLRESLVLQLFLALAADPPWARPRRKPTGAPRRGATAGRRARTAATA